MTPYDRAMNLGHAYNEAMERLNDNDYACFIDHDAMWTTPFWHSQIEKIVEKHKDGGLFVTMTNRVGCTWMVDDKVKSHDIRLHRKRGLALANEHETEVCDRTDHEKFGNGWPASGVVMVVPKSVWKEIGPCPDGFLGVDNWFHQECRNAGYKVYLMPGVYVYHWYRASNGQSNSSCTDNRVDT